MKKYIVVILSLLKLLVFSQDLSYVHYSTHNGLPSNQVYDLYQDNNGFMWFATDRGIAKYDGDKFTQYDQSDGLISNTIFRFFPQENGDWWCSTFQNKWFFFNPDNNIFIPYEYNDTVVKYSKGELNESFYLAENGTVFIGFQTRSGYLAVSKTGEIINALDGPNLSPYKRFDIIAYNDSSFFYYSKSENENLTPYLKTCGFKKSELLIDASETGFYHKAFRMGDYFFFSNNNKLLFNYNNSSILINKYERDIIGIGKYDDSHIWVGFRKGGVKIISLEGGEKQSFLKDKSVTCCYKDVHEGIWFSTLSDGVYHARNSEIIKYKLKDDYISFVTNGYGSKVIVGTFFGENYEIDNKTINLVSSTKDEMPNLVVYNNSQLSYLESKFDVNQKTNQLIYDKKKFIVSRISSFCDDSEKPFLFASATSFTYFNTSKSSFEVNRIKNRIRSLCWSNKGVYIGTLNGLIEYDTSNREVSFLSDSLLKVRIESVKTFNDKVFIGTMGHGLLIMNDDSLIQISKKEGLSSNLVNALFVENDSIIWVATNNGLNRVFIGNSQIIVKQFNEGNGLVDSYINDVYIKENTIWIATRSGFCSMSNSGFINDSTVNLFFQWESVSSLNNFWSDSALMNLDYNQNNLVFKYNAAYFSANNGIEFRYKLVGNENLWNYTSSREVKCFLLNPGSYLIKVQASVNGSDWQANELSKSFVIYPPFYQTNWFYSFIILLICALVYFFFKIRVLSYNKDIVRELLRILLKRLTQNSRFFIVKEQGVDLKINSDDVLYIKSEGNYLDIVTKHKKYVIRCKIGDFLNLVPDKIEYLKINRSHIVRKDKIQAKSSKTIQIANEEFNVSRTYQKDVNDLLL